MTAAAFGQSDRQQSTGRGLVDELVDQPTSLGLLATVVVLITVVGQLTGTLGLSAVVAVFFAAGMIKLLSERRASTPQTLSIGLIHLGVAMLIAGTV